MTTKNTGSSEEHRGRRAALNADMRHRVSEMMEIIWELSFKSVATNASSSSAASCSRFTCTATSPPQSLTSHVDRHNISRQLEHASCATCATQAAHAWRMSPRHTRSTCQDSSGAVLAGLLDRACIFSNSSLPSNEHDRAAEQTRVRMSVHNTLGNMLDDAPRRPKR